MAAHDEHAHHNPKYGLILGILIGLTFLTVITGREMDLGAAALPVAVTIATIKAALVVAFFMHMLEAEFMNKLIFGTSVFFLILLILGAWGDLATRWKPAIPVPQERSISIQAPPGHGHAPAHEPGVAPAPAGH